MTTPDDIETPPEAALVHYHRTQMRPALSMAKAAAKAGISPSRWRGIEKGWRWESKGVAVRDVATAETLAKVAEVLNITPEQLRKHGREDAAEELQKMPRSHMWHGDLSGIPDSALLDELGRRLDERSNIGEMQDRKHIPEIRVMKSIPTVVETPSQQLAARRVNPDDSSTFE